MSKSHSDPRSRIQLNDSSEEIASKIRLALTDSVAGVSYDPEARPGVSNLLDIMSYISPQGESPSQLAEKYSTLNMRAFKNEVTAYISASLHGIRKNYLRLIDSDDDHYLEDVAHEGSRKARVRAESTIKTVKQSLGLV